MEINAMKFSQYNYLYNNEEKVLIYNTRIGSLVLLSVEEYESINNGTANNFLIEKLYSLGILVDKNFDEYELIVNRIKFNIERKKEPLYRILPTTRCNARCFYCYEKGMKQEDMTTETVCKTIEFIKKKTVDETAINVNWFGGEPLLRFDIMKEISQNLIKYCNENKKGYCASIITNGSLFNNKIISELDSLRIRTIQITLDGTELEYSKRKNYYDKTISLETVLNNIECILKISKARVNIRLNFDSKNFEDIKVLIKQLKLRFKGYSNLEIYAYPLFDTKSNHNPNLIEIDDAAKYFEELIALLGNKKNALFLLPRPKQTSCFVFNESSCVINANGDLLKCTSAPNSIIGNLECECIDDGLNNEWKSFEIIEKCKVCKLLPLCLGGCKAKLMNNEEFCCVHKNLMNVYLKNIIRRSE